MTHLVPLGATGWSLWRGAGPAQCRFSRRAGAGSSVTPNWRGRWAAGTPAVRLRPSGCGLRSLGCGRSAVPARRGLAEPFTDRRLPGQAGARPAGGSMPRCPSRRRSCPPGRGRRSPSCPTSTPTGSGRATRPRWNRQGRCTPGRRVRPAGGAGRDPGHGRGERVPTLRAGSTPAPGQRGPVGDRPGDLDVPGHRHRVGVRQAEPARSPPPGPAGCSPCCRWNASRSASTSPASPWSTCWPRRSGLPPSTTPAVHRQRDAAGPGPAVATGPRRPDLHVGVPNGRGRRQRHAGRSASSAVVLATMKSRNSAGRRSTAARPASGIRSSS